MAHAESAEIQIVYALPEQQTVISLTVEPGLTVEQSIRQSGILTTHPEIDLTHNKVGIFSEVCALERPVQAGDRIEIYRELLIDPMEARRLRALK